MTVSAVGSSRSLHLAQHGEQPAGAVEVLHQEPAGRLQVDQQRHVRPGAVEVVQREVDAEPAGDREQVHDGVGGAADRGERDDRVEERRLVSAGVLGSPLGGDHLDGQPAGVVGGFQQPAVGGGRAGEPGSDHAERLGDAAPSSRPCPSCCSGRCCGSSTTRT